MENNKENNKKDISLYKLFWQFLPKNSKKFLIIVLIFLFISAFVTIFYFKDAIGELFFMSQQIEKNMLGE